MYLMNCLRTKRKFSGKQMIDNIIINTIVPIIFAYGHLHQTKYVYKDKAFAMAGRIGTRKKCNNKRTGKILVQKIKMLSHSQSLIELKTQYCDKRKCLECAVGNALLKV